MTMKNKQELIQLVVNLLNAMIKVEELPSAPPPPSNDQVEMLTIKECARQISGLSEHTCSYVNKKHKINRPKSKRLY